MSTCRENQCTINDQGVCGEKENCKDCIGVNTTSCAWCLTPGSLNSTRCFEYDNSGNNGNENCTDIYSPTNNITYDKNDDVRDADTGAGLEIVQIQPQEISLKLRPGQDFTFDVTFRIAENYPVDLYFLVDNTYTMKEHKAAIAEIANDLKTSMTDITNDFRLGFGTFVDKPTVPFTADSWTNCEVDSKCTYGFKNELGLTEDVDEFVNVVKASNISHNLDAPEGGFDALMQVAVCDDKIGWRNNSRKMILYASDGMFHIAGDGRLAGIVRPNDAKCHLDEKGNYTHSLELDYPSVSHLAYTITHKDISVIMAVTEDQKPPYRELQKVLPGSRLGTLDQNILELIQSSFDDIREVVKLNERERIDGMASAIISPTTAKAQPGESVTFSVTVRAEQCLEDDKNDEDDDYFTIEAVGLSDKVKVNVKTFCPCECESLSEQDSNSISCNSTGTLKCGQCNCKDGYSGEQCECNINSNADQAERQKDCIKSGHTNGTGTVCENRGRCECGKCTECNRIHGTDDDSQRFTGRFCECNNYSCPKTNKKMCGGNGKCECGECTCNTGWITRKQGNRQCDCPTSNKTCIGTYGKECSGHGKCVCGKCECDRTEQGMSYSGATCEFCHACPRCQMNRECAQCVRANRESCPKDLDGCKHVEVVPELQAASEVVTACSGVQEDCIFYYVYDDSDRKVYVQEKQTCVGRVSSLHIIIYVVSSVVGAGILLLFAWRTATYIIDKREMAKFEREKATAKWEENDNPLFKSPTTQFTNTAFGGVSQPDDVMALPQKTA